MDNQPTAPTNNITPAAAPAVAAPLPGVPDQWPGAFGAYKYSKQAVKLNLGTVISLLLLQIVFGGLIEWKLKSVGELIAYILGGLFAAALALTYIAGARGQRQPLGQALNKGLGFWLKMIGLNILVILSMIVSLLLLVIPFFFVFPRLVLANYFLVDKKMGVMEAYQASWAATKGNVSKVWGIIGATVLMGLLMVTIIGIPVAIYLLIMYSAVFVVLYEFLGKSQPVSAANPAATNQPIIPTQNNTAGTPPASPPALPIQ